jgi:outer membrane protein, adhesin transport system
MSGCGAKPSNLEEMSQTIAATLTETSAPEAQASRGVVSLEGGLANAVLRAVQANDGYKAAEAQEAAAMGRIGVASSAQRPQASGNAILGGIRESGGTSPDQTTTGIAGGVNLSQLIYDGGESTAAVNQATAEALAARSEREARGNELALQAARAWIDVWQFDERLRLLRSRSSEMDMMVGQMERMAANGFVDRAALDSARRQIVDISLEETRLDADLREARVRFQRFFNQAPGRLGRSEDVITLAEARAAAKDWQQSPALERSAAELLIARSAVTSAESAFRPRARLQAGLTSPMQKTDPLTATAGLAVDFNFWDGGRRQAQLETATARVEAAQAQLADAQRTLEAELDAALTRLAAIERSMPLVAEQIRLSASEAETSRSQITTGQSTLRQLVEAEIEYYRAQDRQIAMRAERQTLLLTIAARTGELARQIGLDQGKTR